MTKAQTRVQLFLNGTCFDQYQTSAPNIVSGQVRAHLDAGWIISDARRFRCNEQSSFHVYFVRPNDGTSTATLVVRVPHPAPCEICNAPAGTLCHTCWLQERAEFNATPRPPSPSAPEEYRSSDYASYIFPSDTPEHQAECDAAVQAMVNEWSAPEETDALDNAPCDICGSEMMTLLCDLTYHGNTWRQWLCSECMDAHRTRSDRPTVTLVTIQASHAPCAKCRKDTEWHCESCDLFLCPKCHVRRDCPTCQGEMMRDHLFPAPSDISNATKDTQRPRWLARLNTVAVAAFAFLAVTSSTHAAELHAFVTNIPAGCVVQRVFEDHSAYGLCAGGYTVGFDPDDDSWTIPVVKDTLHLTDICGIVHDVPVYY